MKKYTLLKQCGFFVLLIALAFVGYVLWVRTVYLPELQSSSPINRAKYVAEADAALRIHLQNNSLSQQERAYTLGTLAINHVTATNDFGFTLDLRWNARRQSYQHRYVEIYTTPVTPDRLPRHGYTYTLPYYKAYLEAGGAPTFTGGKQVLNRLVDITVDPYYYKLLHDNGNTLWNTDISGLPALFWLSSGEHLYNPNTLSAATQSNRVLLDASAFTNMSNTIALLLSYGMDLYTTNAEGANALDFQAGGVFSMDLVDSVWIETYPPFQGNVDIARETRRAAQQTVSRLLYRFGLRNEQPATNHP